MSIKFNKASALGYKVLNKKDKPAEIEIFDDIGSDIFGDAYSPAKLTEDLKNIKSDTINVYINSGGGEVYAGFAIYNILMRHEAKIIVYVEGVAGSIASIIAMAGDRIVMPENSDIMIHLPWSWSIGNAHDMRAMADELDRIGEKLVNIYTARTGGKLTSDEIRDMMSADGGKGTFINGSEAKEMGFADEVLENKKIAACAGDLSIYDNIPKRHIKAQEILKKSMNKRELEESLRDLGYSKSEALNIISRRKEEAENLSDSGEQLEILNSFKLEI